MSSYTWPPETGVLSVNGDTSSTQTITGGTGISVATSAGTTTITNTDTLTAGVGIALSTVGNNTTISSTSNLVTISSSSSITPNLALGQVQQVTLGTNTTLNAPTNGVNGETFMLIVVQDGVGGRTMAFNSVYKFPGGTAPTLSTAAGATDVLSFVIESSSFILTVFSGNFH